MEAFCSESNRFKLSLTWYNNIIEKRCDINFTISFCANSRFCKSLDKSKGKVGSKRDKF